MKNSVLAARKLQDNANAGSVLLGAGLAGFWGSCVLRKLLNWHAFADGVIYPDTLQALHENLFWEGIFLMLPWLFVLVGAGLLWFGALPHHRSYRSQLLAGTLLSGFASFNLLEAVVANHLLGLHHVAREQPNFHMWDFAWLVLNGALLLAGLLIWPRRIELGKTVAHTANPAAEASVAHTDGQPGPVSTQMPGPASAGKSTPEEPEVGLAGIA